MSGARSIGKALFANKMTSVYSLGTGAVVGLIAAMLAENVAWFNRYWFAMPGLMAFSGHIVKNTVSPLVGSSMIGSAGTMAYYNWKLYQASVRASGGVATVFGPPLRNDVTRGLQAPDTGSPMGDYAAQLRNLPDTAGLQAPMATQGNTVQSMRVAA